MLIEVKVSGFDSRKVTVMSQKMVGFELASMADPRERVLGGFECWADLYWTILLELG